MKFYQRIEVWVLLLLTVAAAVFVLQPGTDSADWEESQPAADEAPDRAIHLTLRGATLERDYGNARLDLDVRVANGGAHPLVLTPPRARLLAGAKADREAPPFFLPAEPPPEVGAGATSEVRLRYWLEAADLQGPLRLVVDDARLEVKSAAAFDLEALENRKAVTLRGVAW